MPYSVKFMKELGLFRVEFFLHADLEEILVADREVLADPHWAENRRMMCVVRSGTDLSTLTLEGFLQDAMPYMEASFATRGAEAREAWVVPDPWNSPIVQVWEQLPDKDPVHRFAVFEEELPAVDWLLESEDLSAAPAPG